MFDQVAWEIEFSGRKSDLEARLKAKKLETYNRRDNVKMIGLKEDAAKTDEPEMNLQKLR